jgi:hypothetical protein
VMILRQSHFISSFIHWFVKALTGTGDASSNEMRKPFRCPGPCEMSALYIYMMIVPTSTSFPCGRAAGLESRSCTPSVLTPYNPHVLLQALFCLTMVRCRPRKCSAQVVKNPPSRRKETEMIMYSTSLIVGCVIKSLKMSGVSRPTST